MLYFILFVDERLTSPRNCSYKYKLYNNSRTKTSATKKPQQDVPVSKSRSVSVVTTDDSTFHMQTETETSQSADTSATSTTYEVVQSPARLKDLISQRSVIGSPNRKSPLKTNIFDSPIKNSPKSFAKRWLMGPTGETPQKVKLGKRNLLSIKL